MMARLPGFSDEAWRVIQGAKAAAMSEDPGPCARP